MRDLCRDRKIRCMYSNKNLYNSPMVSVSWDHLLKSARMARHKCTHRLGITDCKILDRRCHWNRVQRQLASLLRTVNELLVVCECILGRSNLVVFPPPKVMNQMSIQTLAALGTWLRSLLQWTLCLMSAWCIPISRLMQLFPVTGISLRRLAFTSG